MQLWSIILLLFSVSEGLKNERSSVLTPGGYQGSRSVTKFQDGIHQHDGIETGKRHSRFQETDQIGVLSYEAKPEIKHAAAADLQTSEDKDVSSQFSTAQLEKNDGKEPCPECQGKCLLRCPRNSNTPAIKGVIGANSGSIDGKRKGRRLAKRRATTSRALQRPNLFCAICMCLCCSVINIVSCINNCCCCCCPGYQYMPGASLNN